MHACSEQNRVATVLKWGASARFANVEEDYIASLLSNKDRENAKKASINAVGVV